MGSRRIPGKHLTEKELNGIKNLHQVWLSDGNKPCQLLDYGLCQLVPEHCTWKSEHCVNLLKLRAILDAAPQECMGLSQRLCQDTQRCKWHPIIAGSPSSSEGECRPLTPRIPSDFSICDFADDIAKKQKRSGKHAIMHFYKINLESHYGGDVEQAPGPVQLPHRVITCSIQLNPPNANHNTVQFYDGNSTTPKTMSRAQVDEWWRRNATVKNTEYELKIS